MQAIPSFRSETAARRPTRDSMQEVSASKIEVQC
jgi:hypothetical protein